MTDAFLSPDPTRRAPLPAGADEVPSALDPPRGCAFRTRCDRADGLCTVRPGLRAGGDGRTLACHHPVLVPGPQATTRTGAPL